MSKVIKNWELTEYAGKTGIYLLTIADNHTYVGSAVNLKCRLLRHRADLLRNDHNNQYLQRCFNKYGYESLKWKVLELCDSSISYKDLLIREKFYIDSIKSNLNLKRDPVTQQCCSTTSVAVYQFNLFGELIQKWNCISEAARQLGIKSSSTIHVCCTNRKRQKMSGGFLWDYGSEYTGELDILYAYDLKGNYLGRFANTVEVYKSLFSNKNRKSVLSCIKKKIDSGIPYFNIYLSTSKDFKIDPSYKPRYNESDLTKMLSHNPIVYRYDHNGILLEYKPLEEWESVGYVRRKIYQSEESIIKPSKTYYSVRKDFVAPKYKHYNEKNIIATNTSTGEILKFPSQKEASISLFGNTKDAKNIYKHLVRNTPFRGYLFNRDF